MFNPNDFKVEAPKLLRTYVSIDGNIEYEFEGDVIETTAIRAVVIDGVIVKLNDLIEAKEKAERELEKALKILSEKEEKVEYYKTTDLWILGGWEDEECFREDCSSEAHGHPSYDTGWVTKQVLERVPEEYHPVVKPRL